MQPKYTLKDTNYSVTPICRTDYVTMDINGQVVDARIDWKDNHQAELTLNGRSQTAYIAQDDNELFVQLDDGIAWRLYIVDEFSEAAEKTQGSGGLRAPMPGVVVEVFVEKGSLVNAGDPVMLIESMKLQTELKAPASGEVRSVSAEAGDSFDKGLVLVDIDTNESE